MHQVSCTYLFISLGQTYFGLVLFSARFVNKSRTDFCPYHSLSTLKSTRAELGGVSNVSAKTGLRSKMGGKNVLGTNKWGNMTMAALKPKDYEVRRPLSDK